MSSVWRDFPQGVDGIVDDSGDFADGFVCFFLFEFQWAFNFDYWFVPFLLLVFAVSFVQKQTVHTRCFRDTFTPGFNGNVLRLGVINDFTPSITNKRHDYAVVVQLGWVFCRHDVQHGLQMVPDLFQGGLKRYSLPCSNRSISRSTYHLAFRRSVRGFSCFVWPSTRVARARYFTALPAL